MKTMHTIGVRSAVVMFVLSALGFTAGCGSGDFLGLEDYQRDFLVAALLLAGADQPTDSDAGDQPPGGQILPGIDGLNCWDLNGNGRGDPEEDINKDRVFDALDCGGAQGLRGPSGTDGVDGGVGASGPSGRDGQDGADGLNCWDKNGDGIGDPDEDRNRDGKFDVIDCRGSAGTTGDVGPAGPQGDTGPPGPKGPGFFDIFVDDLFAREGGRLASLPIVTAAISEPALGRDATTGTSGAVAFRMAIPQSYTSGNDVTMRIFLRAEGIRLGPCFAFTVDARRLRPGSNPHKNPGPRWVSFSATGLGEDELLVIDLPVNNEIGTPGLALFQDLAQRDFLACELGTDRPDGAWYQVLGVEFFESDHRTAQVAGATVFMFEPDDLCAR